MSNLKPVALQAAAHYNHIKAVESLLRHPDTSINQADTYGETTLFIASERGNHEIVKSLLARKDIDVSKARKYEGMTSLQIALQKQHHETVQLLREYDGLSVPLQLPAQGSRNDLTT